MTRVPFVLTVHPFNYVRGGSRYLGLREKQELMLGTEIRCDALVAAYPGLSESGRALIVLTAGYSPESPDKPTPGHEVSLANQQKQYLVASGIPAENIITEPRAWGSLQEIQTLVDVLLEREIAPGKFIDFTDPDHAKRVQMIVSRLCLEEWNPEVRLSASFMPFKLRMREFVARRIQSRRHIPRVLWDLRYTHSLHRIRMLPDRRTAALA